MQLQNCASAHRYKLGSLVGFISALFMQSAVAVSPPDTGIPYVAGDTIYWTSPHWHQVQSRATSLFVCQGGTSCQVTNGSYWVTEHRADGSGSGWLLEVVDAEDSDRPQLTPETFADAVTVSGDVISWPEGGWYQVQDTQTYTELCYGYISSCQVEASGKYKVTNHSLGLNTIARVALESIGPVNPAQPVVIAGVLFLPDDGWYQVQAADTYQTICEAVRSCAISSGIYNIINHTSGQRWDGFSVNLRESPELTSAQCASQGGTVVGDIGDGAIHRPDFRCASGASPIGQITYLEGEPIANEGAVCCI